MTAKKSRVERLNKRTIDHILRCLSYFREDLPLVFILLFLMGCSTAVGFLQAWPVAVLIDSALNAPTDSWMHRLFLGPLPEEPVKRIIGLAIVALLLRVGHELIATGLRLVTPRIHYNGLLRVRCDLYRKLQAMHIDYHRSHPMGDSLFRLTNDSLGFPGILTVITNLLFSVLTLCGVLAALATRSIPLTLFALAVAPPLLWANIVFGRRMAEKTQTAVESDSAFTTSVQRSMVAIVLTQAFGREEEEFGQFVRTARQSVRAWFGIHRQQIVYGLIVAFILGISASLILSYGGILVYRRHLSPGELMIYMSYLAMMYDPLCQITGVGFNVQSGLVGARRVFEVLDRNVAVLDSPDAISLPVQRRRLTLENVGFEYRLGDPVLQGIDLTIEPGQSVAFVGVSGTGKTTLLNLLPRFYDPTVGAIKLDQWDLRRVKLKDARRHIAMVLQDAVILPTSIAENIAYGRPDATQHEIQHAARLAGISGFIERSPDGYQTKLTDGGANLSGGQRQRIALARALLTQAPILVLDEPTSALDAQHEQIVHDTLRSIRGDRMVILVSHRISTIMNCDLIFVLDQGRIVEQGTHRELVRLGGQYAWMAKQHPDTDDAIFPEAIYAPQDDQTTREPFS